MRISDWSSDVCSSDLYSYIFSRAFYQNTPADTLPQSVKDQYALANQFGIVKGYGLLNGRAAIKLDDPAVEIAVFARNLTNKRYLTNSADFLVSFGVAQGTVGDPRTYGVRSEEHTSELQSLMRISYAVLCLNKTKKHTTTIA